MTPGRLARRVLGRRLFSLAGAVYRRLFVDLRDVIDTLPDLPLGARVLEIGGGDGMLAEMLLRARPDLQLVLVDLAPSVGGALSESRRQRVVIHPETSVAAYRQKDLALPDVILVSDVVHHIPAVDRPAFFQDVAALMRPGKTLLVVKDVSPGGIRSRAAWLADRYISGDRQVRFLGADEMKTLVCAAIPGCPSRETDLLGRDAPNYMIAFGPVEAGP